MANDWTQQRGGLLPGTPFQVEAIGLSPARLEPHEEVQGQCLGRSKKFKTVWNRGQRGVLRRLLAGLHLVRPSSQRAEGVACRRQPLITKRPYPSAPPDTGGPRQ